MNDVIRELIRRIENLEEYKRRTEGKGIPGWEIDYIVSTPSSTIDITLPQYARHLRINYYLRSSLAANSETLTLRFNGNSAANYGYQYVMGSGATVSAGEVTGGTAITLGAVPAASATTGFFGTGVIFIPYYSYSSGNHSLNAITGLCWNFAAGNRRIWNVYGDYQQVGAITSITLRLISGQFVNGSRVTVYGLG